jgi:hypothetical protein
MDFNFGAAPTAPLNRATGNLGRLINQPGNQRLYLGHMLDLITTTYNTNYLTPWIAHFGSLVGQNFSGIRDYVDQRVKSVRSQLPPQVPFSITSNGGQDFLVDTTSVVITGRAWIQVKEIRLADRPEPLNFKWPNLTTWQATIPLQLGTNRLEFQAYDFQGDTIASDAITVTSSALGGGLDTDGDGMPDAWELAHGLDPQVSDADLDSDGDGYSNGQEYLAGTDPGVASSRLTLEAVHGADGLKLSFLARAGRSYTVLERDALSGGAWLRLEDADPQVGDHPVQMLAPGGAPTADRFYRLVTPKLP